MRAAVSLIALGISSILSAHEEGSKPRRPVSDPAQLVQGILISNAAAFERGDLAALDSLWADDDSVIVFENGYANHGWADYRDHHLVPEMAELKNVKYQLSDIKTRLAGKTAWATFKYTISADAGERHVEGEGLGTAVLEKRKPGWRIVHWHTSSPRKTPAADSSQDGL